MLTLVIGGAASGKSEFAEAHVMTLPGQRVYIATMEPFDRECLSRIQRHRQMRLEKGFETVECYVDLTAASLPPHGNVLLECMTNLAANEMFGEAGTSSCREVTDRIIAGMEELKKGFQNLVVVTGNVFEDGGRYEQSTMEYIRAMAEINRRLADMADAVIEVVVGIPVILKGEGI